MILVHVSRSGIISGQRQTDIVVKALQTLFQISDAAINILRRIKGVLDPQQRCGPRHELHQAHGPFG